LKGDEPLEHRVVGLVLVVATALVSVASVAGVVGAAPLLVSARRAWVYGVVPKELADECEKAGLDLSPDSLVSRLWLKRVVKLAERDQILGAVRSAS
jgi:hypothetical protein